MHALVTGEAVALELRPAAVPSRLLAGGIDSLLQFVLLFGVAALDAAVSPSVSEAATAALTIVLIVLVLIGYPVAFEALLRGRTPGKMALGLRVVRDDGGPIGFRQAFVRGLAGAFLERPGVTLFVGAIVTMLLNPQSKRIGDLFAGTVVLQERVAVRGGPVALMPPQLAGWAASADLSALSDDLALSVRQFLARSRDLTPTAREDLGGRLVGAVLAVITPPPPPGTPGWAVLSAVLAERRRRDEARFGAPPPPPTWGTAPTRAASVAPVSSGQMSSGQMSSGQPSYGAGLGAPPPRPEPEPSPDTPSQPAESGPGGFVAPS